CPAPFVCPRFFCFSLSKDPPLSGSLSYCHTQKRAAITALFTSCSLWDQKENISTKIFSTATISQLN
ncbi:MAG: hypothetical protein KUG70_02850, partial [Rhodobacteraceae bacterium]|nr:hypothetical protein [Paracoccaceae bacterium]